MAAAVSSRSTGETISRVTRKGRTLTYCLNVIQQPERARACGSGAKSSADRRPVDPPPVVELRIFQGEGPDKEDITFGYKANFFLFATLEVARPMAHGRVQQASSAQIPVLTGMPVSGMAYLDRPTEAGYFIFPDLSVRHEGKYYLSFNLYEETKEEDDLDAEPSNDQKPKGGQPGPDASFDWRLEVKSIMFTVFSAKKFPGLTESTALSRTVAEQGCRVRIRRDVRMRRREGKAGGDFEDANEDEYARPGRALEQEPYRERSRSNSAGSDQGRAQFPDGQQRSEYAQSYYSDGSTSASHAPAPQEGYLAFGNRPSGPQYTAPQPQFAQPPPPVQQAYQPAPSAYHPPGPSQYRPGPPPPPQGNYGYDRQYPQSAYPTNPPREREVYEPEFRRASVASYQPQHPPQTGPYPAVDSNYSRSSYHGFPPRPHSPPMPGGVSLAPLKMPPIETKYDGITSPPGPLSSISRIAPPLHSPSFERSQDRSYSQYSAPPPASAEPSRNGKRPFDTVFNTSSMNQPLFNGMRPSSSHNNQTAFDDDDGSFDAETEKLKMSYKRADGSQYTRDLPSVQ